MFTNWKQNPQQMIRNGLLGNSGAITGGQASQPAQLQSNLWSGNKSQQEFAAGTMPVGNIGGIAFGGGPAPVSQAAGPPPAPRPLAMGGIGNMMGQQPGLPPPQVNMPQLPAKLIGRPMGMIGRPIGTPPGQNPVMQPRQQMPASFAGVNGSGLMGYRPGR